MMRPCPIVVAVEPRDDLAEGLRLSYLAHSGFVRIREETALAALDALNHRTQCHACATRAVSTARTTELL